MSVKQWLRDDWLRGRENGQYIRVYGIACGLVVLAASIWLAASHGFAEAWMGFAISIPLLLLCAAVRRA